MPPPTQELADRLQIEEVIEGRARLSAAQALDLYHHAPLQDLGRWASRMAERMHGNKVRTYIIDRNINYTNVCSAKCTFCAFRRDAEDADSYTLDDKALHAKIRECVKIGGTQILLQGGMHPDLSITFYEDMLRGIKSAFPSLHVHAFSPPEFVEFVAVFDIEGFPTPGPRKSEDLSHDVFMAKLRVIMRRLRDAGLDSLPGGGGEILVPHVRRRIGSSKATGKQWLDVMSMAHELGMFTSGTMMFGHIEGVADRIMHMQMIRERQDLAMQHFWPGRFVSFISWPFQPDNTPLGRVPQYDYDSGRPFAGDVLADLVFKGEIDMNDKAACDRAVPEAGKMLRLAGASEYLRTQAVSRLFFDNIHSIGASWVTMGPKIGQLGLFFGASDMGSVMMEENVVSAAGTTYCLNEASICHLIRDAGFTPAQRDNTYQFLKVHESDDANSPDLQVKDWSEHRPAGATFKPPQVAAQLTVGDTAHE